MKKEVKDKFKSYPAPIRQKLRKVRNLILATAKEYDLGDVEEALKWGEPSYLVKQGSAVRFDWKAKNPEQYAIYFNCNTKLVDTFKQLYGDLFRFESNRAIVFSQNGPIHEKQLKHCIKLALSYHKVKHSL